MGSSSSTCSSPPSSSISCLPPSPASSITTSLAVSHKKTRLLSPTQQDQHLPLPYPSSAFWNTAPGSLDAFATPPLTPTYGRHLCSVGITSAGSSLTSASLHAPNRIRSPPGLIPLPTQQPIRPRPIPPPRHPPTLTPGMTDWESVSWPYLYSLLHTRALPPSNFGLGRVNHFFPPSVP